MRSLHSLSMISWVYAFYFLLMNRVAKGINNATGPDPSCPCISAFPSNFLNSNLYNEAGNCIRYSEEVANSCVYPLTYGLSSCEKHDENLEPSCSSLFSPGYCTQSWCYVDPNNCDVPFYESSFFPDQGIFYSYETCGSVNSFVTFQNSGLPVKASSLLKLVQAYSAVVKSSVEGSIAELNTADASNSETCFMENGCTDTCIGCESNSDWNQVINVDRVNTMIHPTNPDNIQANLDEISCLSPFISSNYLRIASKEYNDESRIAYQYFGYSKSGAMTQWPASDFCSNVFDARIRPWFVNTVSGRKSIVLVIDVSGSMGSMAGSRIELAKSAANEVLTTLAWTDKVAIILFNSVIVDEYSFNLVEASSDNIDSMRAWIESNVVAGGGTSFVAPLERAYTKLSNVDSDLKMILFLSDGVATDNDDVSTTINNLNGQDEDVVVFTYGLGTNVDATALSTMACATSGIYFPVTSEQLLPQVMQSYFQYFIEIVDYCNLAWVNYYDFLTGEELIAACSPIFDPRSSDTSLVGVNCVDLNMIVSNEDLRSALSGRYEEFIQALKEVRPEGSTPTKITDGHLLATLRDNAGSSCAGDLTPLIRKKASKVCQEPPLTAFDGFILQTISTETGAPQSDKAAAGGDIIIIGISVGISAFVLLAAVFTIRRIRHGRSSVKEEPEPTENSNIPAAGDIIPNAELISAQEYDDENITFAEEVPIEKGYAV